MDQQDVCSDEYLDASHAAGTPPTYAQHAACELAIWERCVETAKETSADASMLTTDEWSTLPLTLPLPLTLTLTLTLIGRR